MLNIRKKFDSFTKNLKAALTVFQKKSQALILEAKIHLFLCLLVILTLNQLDAPHDDDVYYRVLLCINNTITSNKVTRSGEK